MKIVWIYKTEKKRKHKRVATRIRASMKMTEWMRI